MERGGSFADEDPLLKESKRAFADETPFFSRSVAFKIHFLGTAWQQLQLITIILPINGNSLYIFHKTNHESLG